jgi:uncharacterized protein YcsI (UPF0317 family)
MTTSVLYVSNIACRPAGRFSGPVIVSMRRVPRDKVTRAVQVTSRFPNTHGAPVHIGDPAAIGIHDMAKPWFGIPPKFAPDEVPVFWACVRRRNGRTIDSASVITYTAVGRSGGCADMARRKSKARWWASTSCGRRLVIMIPKNTTRR